MKQRLVKRILELGNDKVQDIIPQLIELGYVKSKSEFIRLIKQNGVQLNKEKIVEHDLDRILMNEEVLQIGKKRFIRFKR